MFYNLSRNTQICHASFNECFCPRSAPLALLELSPLAPLQRLDKASLFTSFCMPLFLFLINNSLVLLCNEHQLISLLLFVRVKGTVLLCRNNKPKSPSGIRNTAFACRSLLSSQILDSQDKMLFNMNNGQKNQDRVQHRGQLIGCP